MWRWSSRTLGVPEVANLELGCGNPQAITNLKPGETCCFLNPGGCRFTSVVVAFRPLPENGLNDSEAYTGCIAGAFVITDLQKTLKDAGLVDIRISPKGESKGVIDDWAPALGYRSTVYLLPVLIGVNLYKPTALEYRIG